MSQTRATYSATCPDCDGEVVFQRRPALEAVVVCPHCDAELEVVDNDPIELAWTFSLDDDYDDDDYDYDDDDDYDYDDDEDED